MVFEAATYGDRIADVFDEFWPHGSSGGTDRDTDDAVEFLVQRVPQGRALELGIGTGRVALPLAARGLRVVGIDASQRMLNVLQGKPGGAGIEVHTGDMINLSSIQGAFDLVYVVASTLYGLETQAKQLACIAGVAERLTENGMFVVEAFVPDRSLDERGPSVSARGVDVDRVWINAAVHDGAAQTVTAQQILITEQGARLYPAHLRYIWPSELDLMARLAGLHLVERQGGFRGEPYLSTSPRHVSVFARRTPASLSATPEATGTHEGAAGVSSI